MKNKKLIFGITAIVLAIAIFAISEKMTNAKPPEHRQKFFPGLADRHITGLVIRDGNGGVKLEKTDGEWMVSAIDTAGAATAFAADSASVQIAVEKIVSMNKSELVSANPENQSKFEVDSAGGTSVEVIVSGKTAGILRIGKSGTEWNSNYVRMADSDAVYLIRGGIRYSLFTDIERWKKIEPPPPETDSTASGGADENAVPFGDNVLIGAPE